MKKEIKNKQEKGITLIALVVTIIVLLILAGVAINLTIGQNGIITRAMDSTERTEIADEREAIILAYQACLIDTLGGNVTAKQLEDELKSQGRDVSVTQEGENLIVTYNQTKRTYQINQNGDVSQVANAAISTSMEVAYNNTVLNADDLPNVKEVTSENIPIPKGFYYVGGTKDTGLVISDVERDDLDNTLQGNQFVWVPVNQNQVLKIEVTSEENITGITLYNPDDTTQTLTASGKTFSQEIPISQNGTYELEVTTASGSQLKDLQVTSLYAQDMESWIDEVVENTFQSEGITKEYLLESVENDEYSERYNTTSEFLNAKGYNSLEEFLGDKSLEDELIETGGEEVRQIIEALKRKLGKDTILYLYLFINSNYISERKIGYVDFVYEFYNMSYKIGLKNSMNGIKDNNQNIESVNKYGGFYIGRFEAGKGSNSSSVEVKKGLNVYHSVSLDEALAKSNTMYSDNESVITQVISGAGWDRTMNWLVETGARSSYEEYGDSSTWGNYRNAVGNAAIGAGDVTTTGNSEYWKANNIYDLAGNCEEMTQESTTAKMVTRSGCVYGYCSTYYPAGMRRADGDKNSVYRALSFRVQLFINV